MTRALTHVRAVEFTAVGGSNPSAEVAQAVADWMRQHPQCAPLHVHFDLASDAHEVALVYRSLDSDARLRAVLDEVEFTAVAILVYED